MRTLNRDATTALIRGVGMHFSEFDCFGIEEVVSRAWASATFMGARHELTLRLSGDRAEAAADAFLHDLEDKEFDLRGHILADIRLVSQARTRFDGVMEVVLRLEALTVEESR